MTYFIIILLILLFVLFIHILTTKYFTNKSKDRETLSLERHLGELQKRGYEVVAIMLQGSQNYGLAEYSDNYMSDVDSKAIVLPSFKDFVTGKTPVSTTIVLDNGEHIDTKDIRVMFDMLKKENISYIELLFTKWRIVNPKYAKLIQPLWDHRTTIAAYNTNQFVRCIAGMSMEKRKALCHPYPNLIEKIEKYGFDGKQLSHCVRLNEFLEKYINNLDIEDCYQTSKREELMNLKKQLLPDGSRVMTQEEAIEMCAKYDDLTKSIKDMVVNSHTEEINGDALALLEDMKYKILRKKFKEDIKKGR